MARPLADQPPAEVRAAAEARAVARADGDWATADRLRAEIEATGWKVVDRGTDFRLEPAHAPDVVEGEVVRYGRSDTVPSRLGEAPTGLATAIVVAREDAAGAARAARSILAHAPADVDVVVVADGLDDERSESLVHALPEGGVELIRTSAPLGQGASLNAGARRAAGRIVLVVDPSIEATGDVVGPLVESLEDPRVAIAGPFGLVSADLRHFEETVEPGPAAAIEGYLQAFRRDDVLACGPFDEAFRFYRNLDVWWSLVLRDGSDGSREARVVAGLPIVRHEHVAWSKTSPAERDRLSKRNFYRLLERFRDRSDLAVGA
ncbi:MAG: glycosyltransferase [Chloroflexi bacterium]|nr:glycosyltransferase [Chloroflexota bacterium]